MTYSNHPVTHATATRIAYFSPQATLAMGGVGAVIGATGAAADNIRRVKNGDINKEQAIKNTVKEAAGTGLATAAATAVVGAVGATGLLSLVGLVAVATGTKYLWDASTAPVRVEEPQPAAAKPKPTPKNKATE